MFIKSVTIDRFRNFHDVKVDFEKNNYSNVYSVASINGGGKSTFLQFVFTMLNCFYDKSLHQYIKNMLETEKFPIDYQDRLAKFEIITDKTIELEFVILPSDNDIFDGRLFNALSDLDKKIKENQENWERSLPFIELYNEAMSQNKVTDDLIKMARQFFPKVLLRSDENYFFYNNIYNCKDIKEFRQFVIHIKQKNNFIIKNLERELKSEKDNLLNNLDNQNKKLESEGYKFITTFSDDSFILLRKSTGNEEELHTLSKSIFLNGPSTQIYLFLKKKYRNMLVNSNIDFYYPNQVYDACGGCYPQLYTYSYVLYNVKNKLENFYTYDFVSKSIIIKACKRVFEEDSKEKLRTNKYGHNYDDFIEDLNNFFGDKKIVIESDLSDVKFFLKSSDQELNPEDLSHGELKRLSIFIWLRYIVRKDCVVLMDEIDIALHPSWLYNITRNLKHWSSTTQIVLATHSPQIVSSTYYKNIIKLENIDSKVVVRRLNKPPLDRDINAIVRTIMDAPDFPLELLDMHKRYRKLVEAGQSASEEARLLKEEILEHESENSSFWQEINFDLDLM